MFKKIILGALFFWGHFSFAQSINNLVFIGTSNTDTGRCLSSSLFPGNTCSSGPYTTPNGQMWSVTLGGFYGIGVTSNLGTASSSIAPGIGMNNNYSQGGAYIYDSKGVSAGSYSTNNLTANVWSGAQQVSSLIKGSGGILNSNTLYLYEMGTNDLKSNYNVRSSPYYVGTYGTGTSYFQNGSNHPTYVDGTYYATTVNGYSNISPGSYVASAMDVADLNNLASLSAQNVIKMANAGAKYLVVTNVIAGTKNTANAVGLGAGWTQMTYDSVSYYNQTFWNNIAQAGVNFIPADFSSVANYIAVNASTYGFSNNSAYNPACGKYIASFNCTSSSLLSNPNSYLFADFIGHFASGVQTIQAQYVQSLITAPSQIGMLTETSVSNRTNLMSTFHQQISQVFEQKDPFHFWFSGDSSHITMNQSNGLTNTSGSPFAFSVAAGYRLDEHWIAGGAISNTAITLGYNSGGQFNQTEYAFSTYAGFQKDHFWGHGVLTYGVSNYNTNRQFNLGIVTQNNTSTTSGNNTSASIEGGYYLFNSIGDIHIKHSPIIGVTVQKSTVSGFTENNPNGAPTALSFADQTRNSTISELGYLMSIQLGMWQPFARATWNHELANTDRNITTSLTSTNAPSYYMPAMQFGNDWGAAMIGVNAQFTASFRGYALLNTQFAQNNQTNTTGSVGINIGF